MPSSQRACVSSPKAWNETLAQRRRCVGWLPGDGRARGEGGGQSVPHIAMSRSRTALHKKKAGTLVRIPALFGLPWTKWWRWGELNPRPKELHLRHYMLSSPLVLVLWQHDVRSTPQDTPALVKPWLAGRRQGRFRDDDPTSTSTGTSGFGAYALSGESVDVVVGVWVFAAGLTRKAAPSACASRFRYPRRSQCTPGNVDVADLASIGAPVEGTSQRVPPASGDSGPCRDGSAMLASDVAAVTVRSAASGSRHALELGWICAGPGRARRFAVAGGVVMARRARARTAGRRSRVHRFRRASGRIDAATAGQL